MRANVFPTRGREKDRSLCKWCGKVKETIPHISGQCIKTKDAWINRHNRILKALIRLVNFRWSVLVEPNLRNKEGNLRKPVVVFERDGIVAVVDFTVQLGDNVDSLEAAHREKTGYYSELEEEVNKISGGKIIYIFGFIIGSRGKWSEGNDDLLKLLGIKKWKNFPALPVSCWVTGGQVFPKCFTN